MDASRFDALVRGLAFPGPRRAVLAVATGAFTALLTRYSSEVAAGCKKVGKKCKKNGNCCAGARCRHGRCRCKKGFVQCNADGLCRNLASDAAHCGACNQACATGCCAGGVCREMCGDDCCAECFGEAPGEKGPIIDDTEFCCPESLLCRRGTSDPADDLCCWPEDACIDGECCCHGCEGTVVCDDKCCPSVSCCNGKCCGGGQVCARPKKNKPRKCVSANRSCSTDGNCFEGEECRGGVCCSGDRLCFNMSADPVCCPLGEHCDPDFQTCCPNHITCGTTAKKVRIRDK
jgi:hypothetical protein